MSLIQSSKLSDTKFETVKIFIVEAYYARLANKSESIFCCQTRLESNKNLFTCIPCIRVVFMQGLQQGKFSFLMLVFYRNENVCIFAEHAE
jgi:hypothetical protein